MVSAENAGIRSHELFETSHRLLGVSRSIKRASQVVTGSQGIGMIWTFETLVVVYIFLVHGDHVVVLLECFMHVSGKDMGDNSVRMIVIRGTKMLGELVLEQNEAFIETPSRLVCVIEIGSGIPRADVLVIVDPNLISK